MSKKFVASTVLVVLMFIALYGTAPSDVDADFDDSADFVKDFSDKFNLDEEEVSSFMQEIRADRFATMQENFHDELSKAVTNGDLSQTQMEDLLDMNGMFWAEVDSYTNLTVDERQEMVKDHLQAMKIWADENNVDFAKIYIGSHFS